MRFDNQQPRHTVLLSQQHRLAWISALLTGDLESLPYRVAGMLVLLYAQPLVRIAALTTAAIANTREDMRISFGAQPVPVPAPFAAMLVNHLNNRPNLRTAGGMVANLWLFPSRRPGNHLDTQSIALKLNAIGISVLGARTATLRSLVTEMPPPIVANLLGYSDTCTQHHAHMAAQPWARYAADSGRTTGRP